MAVRGSVWVRLVVSGILIGVGGCGGGGGSSSGGGPVTPTPPPAVVHVYVIQNPSTFGTGSGTVLQFPAASTGSVSATATITAPTNTSFEYLAVDGTGNLYVSSESIASGDIREYTVGSTGSATPVRSLPAGTTTMIGAVQGLAASAAGEIFVSEDSGAVLAFGATANGSEAPSRSILGADETGGGLSTLVSANNVAADSSDNLYIANEGAPGLMPIVVFGPTATGNVAPLRSIGGVSTTIEGVSGLTTDSVGNLYVASTASMVSQSSASYSGTILVFAPGASGNVAPIRTITGASTTLGRLGGIKLDTSGNIYVVSTGTTGSSPTVLKFAAAASGNVAPTSSFTSPAWTNPDNGLSLAVF